MVFLIPIWTSMIFMISIILAVEYLDFHDFRDSRMEFNYFYFFRDSLIEFYDFHELYAYHAESYDFHYFLIILS